MRFGRDLPRKVRSGAESCPRTQELLRPFGDFSDVQAACGTMLSMARPKIGELRPDTAEVKAIAAIEDAVIRNLRITECYARLSVAVRKQVGEGANWCTFATWASRQAGCTIRGEDLGDRLAGFARGGWTLRHPFRSLWRSLLRRGLFNPKTRLGRIVRAIHSPFDAFERASEAVAIGNRKVFEEIGYEMARYLETCGDDPSADSPGFAQFLNALDAGPPPGGQDWLRRAFSHYQQQRTETRPARRAQLMLLANLEIGFHEQMRLQPEIQRAMEAAPDTAEDLKSRLLGVLPGGWLAALLLRPFTALAESYRRFARDLTRRVISEAFMVLRMPDRELSLGMNLDAPAPAVFAGLDEPGLLVLVKSVEPNEVCADCGAEDWADLHQRMHYIFHLFRAFHEMPVLFDAPFSAEQVERLRAGRIPAGRL